MQSLIITAYKNFDQLYLTIKNYSGKFNCYVHIDKSSSIGTDENIKKLNSLKNVYAICKYKIKWGSYLHMMAIFDLLKIAYKNSENSRFHIISGEDMIIKNYIEFESFFKDNEKNYIELTDISSMKVMKKRYEKFHFQHIFNRKSPYKAVVLLDKIIRQIQYHIPFKRKNQYKYKGLVWSSLSRDGVKVIIEYLTKKRIRNLKYCEIAEEFFIQNSLMEKMPENVIIDKLRYMKWSGENITSPKILDIEDYEDLISSDCFFARKVIMDGNEKQNMLYNKLKDIL